MKFLSVRDLRGRSGELRSDLESEGELVLTSNGKPIAIISPTDEAHFEETLNDLRQARALRAVKRLQEGAVAAGKEGMSEEEIEAEVGAVRQGRST